MAQPAYLDPNIPVYERVQDLLSRLTLDEKLGQFMHSADGIPRLGIAPYNFWSEGLHGVGRNGRATVFPQAIGMAATWNPPLVKAIAAAIGDESRAKYHEALRTKGKTDLYQGLTIWSPNINIFRDPRWGRGQETWGEDPLLTGEMGTAYVKGLQGDDPKYLRVAACAKHFAVHSGPEKLRHSFNVDVSRRDLYETYLPAFKKLVIEGNVEAVMGAYNRVLGEPACTSKLLIQDILRGEWGFTGHVVSDCWALTDVHDGHHYTSGPVETAALALKTGCDLSCGCTFDHLSEALEQGLIKQADIDQALSRVLTTRFKLGMFDPPDQVPYAATPISVVGSKKQRDLAYRAALQSAVLLKNKNKVLPIGPLVKSIFITGPAAACLDVLLGNYYGINDKMTTLTEGIVGRTPEGIKLEYRPGCLWIHESTTQKNQAEDEAMSADLTIVCAGTSPLMEGEEGESILAAESGDRTQIELPMVQQTFIRKLAGLGARTVLVLTGGSPIALGEIAEIVDAILFVWYPGQEGGHAVASLLFGDSSPSGKLTITFPKATADLPPFEDYCMTGRTYRYATHEPLFPFGFGLSYTYFEYHDLKIIPPVDPAIGFRVAVTLKNTGSVSADEVVQLYFKALETRLPAPLSQLIAFQRVNLKPGQIKTVNFYIKPEMLMLVDEEGQFKLEPGKYQLTAGGCSPGARGEELGAPQPVSEEFQIS
ncbi:MAG: glycoside hydrolase family 3 N-terminal domain-containing protein [Anaerolineales bacterium]